MARKPRGKTDDETDDQTEENPAGSDAGDGLDQLRAALDGLNDPSGYQVCTYRVGDRGDRHVLRVYGASEFDPFDFAQEWGGGDYLAQVRETVGKKFVTQRSFTVSPLIKARATGQPAALQTPAAAAPQADSQVMNLMMTMLTQSMNQQTAVLTALIGRPQAEGMTIKDVLPLITQKQGTAQDMAALMDVIERSRDMAADAAPAVGGDGASWVMAVPAVLEFMSKMADKPQPQSKPRPQQPPRKTVKNEAPQPSAQERDGSTSDRTSVPRSAPTDAVPPPPPPAASADDANTIDEPIKPDDVLDTLMEIIVGVCAMTHAGRLPPSPDTLARRVIGLIDPDALDECLAAIEPGTLASVLAARAPGDMKAMLTHATLAQQLNAFEIRLRELAEEDDDDDAPGVAVSV